MSCGFIGVRFDVLMAAKLKIQVFWSVAVCHWVNIDCLLECDICAVGSVIGLMQLTTLLCQHCTFCYSASSERLFT